MTKTLTLHLILLLLSLTLLPHPAQAQTAPASLTLTNDTGRPICAIAISPVEADEWGDNWLNEAEGETLPPGETATFEVEAGMYDLAAVDCEGEPVGVYPAITLTGEMSVSVIGKSPATSPSTDPARQCNLGRQLLQEGRWEEALPLLEAGFANRAEADFDEPDEEGDCALALGRIYNQIGQLENSLKVNEVALQVFRATGNRWQESVSLNNTGFVYYEQGRYSNAIDNYEQALDIQQEVNDEEGEAATLNNMGLVYAGQGNYIKAIEVYQKALPISQRINYKNLEGAILNNIGEVYDLQGNYATALENYGKALLIIQEVGDRIGEGTTLNNIGGIYHSQGKYARALDNYLHALSIVQGMHYQIGEATTLNNIGQVYHEQGRYLEALDNYEQALAIRQAIGDRAGEGATYNSISGVYYEQKQYDKALANLQDALSIRLEVGDQAGAGITLNNMGGVYDKQGLYAKALDSYQQALAISREIGDYSTEGFTYNNIGSSYRSQGEYKKALDNYRQALVIHQEIGERLQEAFSLANIGGLYIEQEEYGTAIKHYNQALEILDEIRATAGSDQARTDFIAQYADLYNHTVALHHRLNQPQDAFHIAERGRARTFLDGLATGQVQLEDNAAAELLAQEQELYARRQAVQDSLAQVRAQEPPDEEWLADLEAELAEIEAAYADVQAAIQARGDQLADLVPGRNDNVLTVEQVQGYLDAETTLVSYYVLEDATLVFLLTVDSFEVVELDVTREQAANQVQRLRDAFASRQADISQAVGQELYALLVAPLADKLTTPHLAIVPHGPLHYLPFTALADQSGRYLLEQHSLVTLPSASSLKFLATNSDIEAEAGPDAPLVLGDPTLPEAVDLPALKAAAQEAEAIATLYDTQPLLGQAATESAVRDQATESGILHLAAHGDYNLANPLYSTLYLAADEVHDGRLETHEVYSLDLSQTDLVVLSACETQVDAMMDQTELAVSVGDEIVGLTRTFMFAGTPTVISTLWQVEDRSTGLLMERFHQNLQAGLGKAEALRQAQLSLLREERYAAPYYWAGFVLSGDGGVGEPGSRGTEAQGSKGVNVRWVVVGLVVVVVVAGGVWWRRRVAT